MNLSKRLYRAQCMHLFMNETKKKYNLHKVLASRIPELHIVHQITHSWSEICAYFVHAACTHEPDFTKRSNATLMQF